MSRAISTHFAKYFYGIYSEYITMHSNDLYHVCCYTVMTPWLHTIRSGATV
jgi:hypothetical protein